jgi:dephospho-CoA kinase
LYAGKAVIGVCGGIGSGKSRVAALFGEEGCLVLDADAAVRELYGSDQIKNTLAQWWGQGIFTADHELDHQAIGRKVFANPAELSRLESLLHPLIARQREAAMAAAAPKPEVRAFLWDIPLLVEKGLHRQCDAVVFVEAPLELRAQRLARQRGWTSEELLRRENLQLPLDKKRQIAHYVVRNTADTTYARSQVREIFSRILADLSDRTHEG